MGSMMGDWPSYDPHNFSQLRPSDPSNPSKMRPVTYHPTHDRIIPPPDQVYSEHAYQRGMCLNGTPKEAFLVALMWRFKI